MNIDKLFEALLENFGISKEDYIKHEEYYNNNFDAYDNDIYDDIKTRLVHLKNFSNSEHWFNKRFRLLDKIKDKHDQIVDVGYGLPYLEVKNGNKYDANNKVYVDKYSSAEKISREIISLLNLKMPLFLTLDIERQESTAQILKHLKGNKTLLVAIETLEHLDKTEHFISLLKNVPYAYITLPIGPHIPSHHQVFSSVDEARNYLSSYLDIISEEVITPNEESGGDLDEYALYVCYGASNKL